MVRQARDSIELSVRSCQQKLNSKCCMHVGLQGTFLGFGVGKDQSNSAGSSSGNGNIRKWLIVVWRRLESWI